MKVTSRLNVWKKYSKINWYYYHHVQKLAKHVIPVEASVLEIGAKNGELLRSLQNKIKLGVEFDKSFAATKRSKIKVTTFNDFKKTRQKFDYILLSNTLSEIDNIQDFLSEIKKYCHQDTRIVVFYFNYLWKSALDVGEMLGVKSPDYKILNWLSGADVDNFFTLENFEIVKSGKYFMFPFKIAFISDFVNKYVSQLPVVNNLDLINFSIFKPKSIEKDYSVSIVMAARNESGNMKGVLKKIPKLSKKQEIVFVEGHSTDDTYEVIQEEIRKYNGPFTASLFKQKGVGKGDAIRLGFTKAKYELLMILDADLTVDPKELKKFYAAFVEGKGDLIMGSRLIYPMENEAMRTLNIIGNKFFGSTFSFLLSQRIKDTLCGTKVIRRKDYEKIAKNRKVFGDFDPFGDYDLIFGAAKLNLKIIEIPIRYKERTYGKTNISRFTHGFLLLKMCWFAAKNIKFV